MNEELKGLVEQMKADGQPLTDIVAFIDKYEQENPAEEVEKEQDSQTQGATVESQDIAPENLEYKSENISSESGEFKFDPYKFEDLSLSTDQQGGLGVSKTYTQESATTMSLDDDAKVGEKRKKREENKIAQAKYDAEKIGDNVFLDLSKNRSGAGVYDRSVYNLEVPESIDGSEKRAHTIPTLAKPFTSQRGYWENVDERYDTQQEYIDMLWKPVYESDLIEADNDKNVLNEKVENVSADYLKLDVDKEIKDLNDQIDLLEDGEEKDKLIAQRDEKFAGQDYIPLYEDDGSVKGFIREEQEDQAQMEAASKDLDVLEQSRLELYYKMTALQQKAQQLENTNNPMLSVSGGTSILEKGIFAISKLGKDSETLQKMPGNSQIAQRFNEVLDQFIIANRAIEVKANPAALKNENFILEGLDETVKAFVPSAGPVFTEGNDKNVEVFKQWYSEATGETIDENVNLRGESELRAVSEYGRGVATHLAPLIASIYLTKKIPVGIVSKASKYTKGGVTMLDRGSKGRVVTLGEQMAKRKNALRTYLTKNSQSKNYKRAVDVALGAADEVVKLGIADVVGAELFNAPGFVYNEQSGETNFTFPAALGAGNIIGGKFVNYLTRTKLPIVSPIIAMGSRSKSISALSRWQVGAASGTATLLFAEAVDEYKRELLNDRKYFEAKELENVDKKTHLFGNYIGMMMLGGGQALTGAAKGLRYDIARMRNKLPGSDKAAANLGIKYGASEKEINVAVEKKIKEIKKDNTLSNEQKQQQINQTKKDGNAVQFLHEYNAAQKAVKGHDKYLGFLTQMGTTISKIKQGRDLTPKEKEQIAKLEQYEFDYVLAELGVTKNSVDGKLFDLKKQSYKTTVDALDSERIFGKEREQIIQEMDKYSNLQTEKNAILEQIKQKPELAGIKKNRLEVIDAELAKLENSMDGIVKSYDNVYQKMQAAEIEFSKQAASELGVKGFNILSANGFARILMQRGFSMEKAIENAETSTGFYDPVKDQIYLNKTRMDATRDLGAPLHELTHAILRKSLKAPNKEGQLVMTKEGMEIVDKFRNSLSQAERKVIDERIDVNYKAPGQEAKYYEEFFTAWSDAVKNREITYNATTGQRISDVLYPVLKKFPGYKGFQNTDINGENIFLMLQALQRNSLKGKLGGQVKDFAIKERSVEVEGEFGGIYNSKNISKEVAEKVISDISKAKKIVEASEKYKFDVTKDPIYQRVSKRIAEAIEPTAGRLRTELTKRLFDSIAEDAKGAVTRDIYQKALKTEIVNMVMREYDPTKQTLEKFIVNRGWLRTQSLAKRLGVLQEVVEGKTKTKEYGMLADVGKQRAQRLVNMLSESGPRIRERSKEISSEISKDIEAQIQARINQGKTREQAEAELQSLEIIPGKYKATNPKRLTDIVEMFITNRKATVKGSEVVGDRAMAERIVKQINDKQQLNAGEIAVLKKVFEADWLAFDAALPQGFTSKAEATIPRMGKLAEYYNQASKRATQETFGIDASPSGRNPYIRIQNMTKEAFLKPILEVNKAKDSGLLKNMMLEFVRAFENQAIREPLNPKGRLFQTLADGRSRLLFSKNETGESLASFIKEGKATLSDINFLAQRMLETVNQKNNKYQEITRQADPIMVDLIENVLINVNNNLSTGALGYQKILLKSGVLPESIKNNLSEAGMWKGETLDTSGKPIAELRPKTKKYIEQQVGVMAEVHPLLASNGAIRKMLYSAAGFKDGHKGSLNKKKYEVEIENAFDKAINSKKGEKLLKEYKEELGLSREDVQNIANNFAPMEFTGTIKNILTRIWSEPSLVKKETMLKAEYERPGGIADINKANRDLYKIIIYSKRKAREANKFDDYTAFYDGKLQTSITSGPRALSAFEYMYLREGVQWGSNPPAKTVKNYEAKFEQYLESWRKTVDFKEVFKENLEIYDNVRVAELKTIKEAVTFKNEHLLSNAITAGEATSYILGKNLNINNIVGNHKTLWATKRMNSTKFIDRKVEVDGKLMDNKVSFEGDMRITKFLPEAFNKAKNRTVSHVSGENAASYISKINNLKSIYEGIPNPIRGEKAPRILMSKDKSKQNENIKIYNKALELGRLPNKKSRGMSTFDFDETLIDKGKNFILATKDGKTIKITSGEWPIQGPKLAEQGYKFDFKDFVNVRGGVDGPLLNKFKQRLAKFGPDNMFILTARPPEAATAIYGWLKSKGLEIPLENITGLGNSTGEAKAMWMLKKFSEGYNDMYFVDDALPNVKAVKEVLRQLDIKSDVQQALKFSKDTRNSKINEIMEYSLGVKKQKQFSKAEAELRGAGSGRNKGLRGLFIPDSAADLELLIEPLLGKGKQGLENRKWFKDNLLMPFERGINNLNKETQRAQSEYMALRKQIGKKFTRSLGKEVPGTSFTNDMAARVYVWNKLGFETPGLAEASKRKLLQYVESNPELKAFADGWRKISKDKIKEPTQEWWAETMATEIQTMSRGIRRTEMLNEWIDAKNEIFNEANMNKMEAALGKRWREVIEDMFFRMETGQTKPANLGKNGAMLMNYLNGSVGAIMNFNTRSATLQLISSLNFINHSFNNPIKAAAALANVPQYAKDLMMIMNSDMLVQRRNGLRINVTEAEIAAAAEGGLTPKKVIAKILQAGYIPTKVADSLAISMGGATYYRNRVKDLMKKGMSKAEAEKKAFLDFQALAERTQQSARADLLSMQQTSFAGRLILPFANTPMQMLRIMKKEMQDVGKGRYEGFVGENSLTHKASKIGYYGFIQSMIFAGLQSGLAAVLDSEDDDKIKEKKIYAVNSVISSFLRGMGIQGAIVDGLIKSFQTFEKEGDKGWKADYSEVAEQLLNVSPTIGSKFRKLDSAGNNYRFAKESGIGEEMGFDIDNPYVGAGTLAVEALTNIPVNRVIRKVNNLRNAADSRYDALERLMMFLGWSNWDLSTGLEEITVNKGKKNEFTKQLGVQDMAVEEAKKRISDRKKQGAKQDDNLQVQKNLKQQKKNKEEGKKVTCAAITRGGSQCKNEPVSGGFCTIHQKVEQGDEERQCSKIKGNGERCKMKTKNKSGLCYYHD